MFATARIHTVARFAVAAFIVTCCVGAVLAVRNVARVLDAATPVTPVYFDHGLTGFDPKAPKKWTNQYCGECHKQAYEQWKVSRHAESGVAHNFELEFLDSAGGRQQHCINCHAPRNSTGHLFPTEQPPGIDKAYEEKSEWIQHGIDCLTCHVRDGQVLVSKHSEKAADAHPIRVAPELGKAEFCAGCHQFSFKSRVLPDGYFGQLQQASFEEFLDYHRSERAETRCQDCHMEGGDHTMPGGYDNDMLKRAVDIAAGAEWESEKDSILVSAEAITGHVGHRVPGGEHFRYLTLRTSVLDATGKAVVPASSDSKSDQDEIKQADQWPQIESLRRVMGQFEQGSSDPNDRPMPDTRLWPGEVRTYRYRMAIDPEKIKGPLRVRVELWYHLMDEEKAQSFNHSLDEIKWMVRSKEVLLESK